MKHRYLDIDFIHYGSICVCVEHIILRISDTATIIIGSDKTMPTWGETQLEKHMLSPIAGRIAKISTFVGKVGEWWDNFATAEFGVADRKYKVIFQQSNKPPDLAGNEDIDKFNDFLKSIQTVL